MLKESIWRCWAVWRYLEKGVFLFLNIEIIWFCDHVYLFHNALVFLNYITSIYILVNVTNMLINRFVVKTFIHLKYLNLSQYQNNNFSFDKLTKMLDSMWKSNYWIILCRFTMLTTPTKRRSMRQTSRKKLRNCRGCEIRSNPGSLLARSKTRRNSSKTENLLKL